ncbi:M48 family metalloprotease [Labrys sedimenti]|uniref:M48 family metalloprotease n=1 Tax=Labrys sedimenti TaxID=3106036 RepID=UPI002ACA3CA5|nr:M48 family metalloprotease [Labrys sp. ZIDIC5]MDZ5448622.1 M48 family metalloprotease [Labrys sp. ZIDIC5]
MVKGRSLFAAIATVAFGLGVAITSASGQVMGCIKDYYAHKALGIAQSDAEQIVKEIGAAMAIKSDIVVIPCQYANRVQSTIVQDSTFDGVIEGEYIVYDPRWFQEVLGTNKVEIIAVLGHELGHFVQRHLSFRRNIPDREKEEEADFFAGCAVASMGRPWQSMFDLLERIRLETDDVYPDRLRSEEVAKRGYDTCSRTPLPSPQVSDLKLSVIANSYSLKFLANNRLFANLDIHDWQNGADIESDDIVYGRNSVAVRLGWKKDMFVIFQVKEDGAKLCSNQLFAALRDGSGITITTRSVDTDGTKFGVRYGRNHDLYNEFVARNADLKYFFDPRAPRTGVDRHPEAELKGTLNEFTIVDNGCV